MTKNMDAITLVRRDVREYDQIVTLLTKDQGKRSLIARGVKKITSKNAAHIEPCCFVSVDIAKGKDLDCLIRSIPQYVYKDIKSSMIKSYIAQYLCQFVDKFTQEQEVCREAYHALKENLRWLEETDKPMAILPIILLELMSTIGFAPQFDTCMITGQKEILDMVLVPELGGVCSQKRVKSGDGVTIIVLNGDEQNLVSAYAQRNFTQVERLAQAEGAFHGFVLAYMRHHTQYYVPNWLRS